MPLNATPGDPAANSYTDIIYADAYFGARLHSETWTGETDPLKKENALMWATLLLDPEPWKGEIVTDTQALRHPRANLYDADGRLLADDAVAKAIQDATCEYGIVLMESDTTLDTGLESYDRLKADVIELGINQDYLVMNKTQLPANVQRLLNGYIQGTDFGLKGGSMIQIRMVRG